MRIKVQAFARRGLKLSRCFPPGGRCHRAFVRFWGRRADTEWK
jgi:hypothetical protein